LLKREHCTLDPQLLSHNIEIAVVAAVAILGGLFIGWLGRGGLQRKLNEAQSQLARAESQTKEQSRMVARMRSEQGTVASLALSLPSVVRELNRSDLDPRRVPGLILQLAEAIFQPGLILFYETRRPPGGEGTKELHLVASKGLSETPDSLKHMPFGTGKIGWVAEAKLDMLKEAWVNLTRTDGEIVQDNHPTVEIDILGPLVHHDVHQEEVLGVLCLGAPGIRPRDEKLMFQMVTNLGSLALVNAKYRSKLREQANTDGLTGLLNKRFFLGEALGAEIFKAEQQGQSLSIFIFDIDHFKNYNDNNGHPAGDELLRGLSALLKKNLRPGDLCCRYGGEEFILAMPGADGRVALQVAERIRRAIEQYDFAHQEKQPNGNLTISGGIAVFPQDGDGAAELTEHADQALYHSKRTGRNRVTRYRGVDIGDVGSPIDIRAGSRG